MGRAVVRAQVRLGLDDAPRAHRASVIVYEVHADERACDGERAAFEEAALRFSTAGHRARW